MGPPPGHRLRRDRGARTAHRAARRARGDRHVGPGRPVGGRGLAAVRSRGASPLRPRRQRRGDRRAAIPEDVREWPTEDDPATFGDEVVLFGDGTRCVVVEGEAGGHVVRRSSAPRSRTRAGRPMATDRCTVMARPLLPGDEVACPRRPPADPTRPGRAWRRRVTPLRRPSLQCGSCRRQPAWCVRASTRTPSTTA